MADENNLVIGATVDVEQLRAGLQTSVGEIKTTTQNMGISFTEMSTPAPCATRQISDDKRDAAETFSAEWTRAAEASLAYSPAQPVFFFPWSMVAFIAGVAGRSTVSRTIPRGKMQ
jgi:hypothetical protein